MNAFQPAERDRWTRREQVALTAHPPARPAVAPYLKALATPIALFVFPAVIIYFAPAPLRALLVFDRAAIAGGDWWRLATGHWIHFGASHLGWNLAAVCGVAGWLEKIQPGSVGRFIAIAAPVLGMMLFLLEPAMHTFGGLSGLACGLTVVLALRQLFHAQPGRIWWLALLVAIAVKLALETVHATPVLARFDDSVYRVSAWAHPAGACVALAFFLSRRRHNSRPLVAASASSSS